MALNYDNRTDFRAFNRQCRYGTDEKSTQNVQRDVKEYGSESIAQDHLETVRNVS